MHHYMRAVGFTRPPKRKEIFDFISKGIAASPSYRAYTTNDEDDDSLLAQYDIELGDNYGITVCGQFDEGDQFFPEYYFPYLESDRISTVEELSVERRIDNYSFAGMVDDYKVGVTLIFRIRNSIEYIKNHHVNFDPLHQVTTSLTALSLKGSILLPIYKSEDDKNRKKNTEIKRRNLMTQAHKGDEAAMRDLTVTDMDTYANILSHIQYEDVYSLVDTYFMPYGAECELYSVMGEIKHLQISRNRLTDEEVVIMTIDCNSLQLDVAINRKDLFGEPEVGRRFKGVIWLQGKLNFPVSDDFKI